ncbi:flavin reductase family protein [Caulobacter segnis]
MIPAPAPPPLATDFRDVLAHLASGVAIVSCWDGDAPRGLLVSSITGLSVDPPRFLFCVRKEAGCHDIFLRRPALSIALLGAADKDEAVRFGGPVQAHERFCPSRWDLGSDAPPTYRQGLAQAACTIDEIVEAQTHSIFIVTASDHRLDPAAPLIAWNRALIAVD